MKMIIRCLVIVSVIGGILWITSLPVAASRGLVLSVEDAQGQEVLFYKESYALVIGMSTYTNGWPNLPGVRRDMEEVQAVLEQHGFDVIVKMDLERNALEEVLDEFINAYGYDPDTRLVLYFASHGATRQLAYGGEMGYIVPVDAPLPDEDERGFLAKAMDMQMIEVYARRIQARHALFVFDSCFSGSLFAISRAAPEHITYKIANPVRQFLTSGSADEYVPDESVFRQQFIAALTGEGDLNGDGYVTGAELGIFLEDSVINYTRGAQHPQYGKIRDPHLDKGDVVFKLPERPENLASMQPGQLPMDAEQQKIARLLEQADAYFERQWYTTPEGTNAFEVYQEVLKLDPTNEHVFQQLQRMLEFYKARAEKAENQGKTQRALEYYQRYLKIAPNDEVALDKIDELTLQVPKASLSIWNDARWDTNRWQ